MRGQRTIDSVVEMRGQRTIDSLCIAIIDAIAEAEGVSPTELDFSLYDFVDPDALERMYSHTRADWKLTFAVDGHRVRVDHRGTVSVTDSDH